MADLRLPQRPACLDITEVPPATRFVLRAAEPFIASCAHALNLDLLLPINRVSSNGPCSALRLGPDEWWLNVPIESGADVARRIDAIDGAHALVDLSHQHAGLCLAGPAVADVLASGCPQPLGLTQFPIDRCTRTVFAQAQIVLWRRGERTFQLDVARSFAPYVVGLLQREVESL